MSKVPFTDLAEVKPSRGSMRLNPDEAVSFIPMEDVSETGQWTGRRTRPFCEVRSGFTCFQENDVLFAKITPCMENGKGCIAVGLRNGIGFGSTEFHILRAIGDNEPRFIYHWTQAREMRLKAENYMIGSAGQQRVQAEFFNRFEIEEIEPAEQRRIAEILDTADEAIQKTEALIAKLKQMKAGLLHDLLTRGIDENGELRDGTTFGTYNLPTGWRREDAVLVCDDITVGVVCNATRHYVDSGVPFLRSQNVRPNQLDASELLFITSRFNEMQRKSILAGNDVIITRTGANIGMACVVPDDFEGANCFSLVVVRPNRKELDSHFLSYYLNSEQGKRLIAQKYFGSAQANFNVGEMEELELLLPPLPEQQEIVRRMKGLESRIENEILVTRKLQKTKAALMHDLLTGKKRVNQPAVATA